MARAKCSASGGGTISTGAWSSAWGPDRVDTAFIVDGVNVGSGSLGMSIDSPMGTSAVFAGVVNCRGSCDAVSAAGGIAAATNGAASTVRGGMKVFGSFFGIAFSAVVEAANIGGAVGTSFTGISRDGSICLFIGGCGTEVTEDQADSPLGIIGIVSGGGEATIGGIADLSISIFGTATSTLGAEGADRNSSAEPFASERGIPIADSMGANDASFKGCNGCKELALGIASIGVVAIGSGFATGVTDCNGAAGGETGRMANANGSFDAVAGC